jgi:hypothetical protein
MRDFYTVKGMVLNAVNEQGEEILIKCDGTSDNTQVVRVEDGVPIGLVLTLTVSIEHGKQRAVVEMVRED